MGEKGQRGLKLKPSGAEEALRKKRWREARLAKKAAETPVQFEDPRILQLMAEHVAKDDSIAELRREIAQLRRQLNAERSTVRHVVEEFKGEIDSAAVEQVRESYLENPGVEEQKPEPAPERSCGLPIKEEHLQPLRRSHRDHIPYPDSANVVPGGFVGSHSDRFEGFKR